MLTTTPRKVLVALGPEDAPAATAFATEEAVRRGCGVHLVHVVPAAAELGLRDDELTDVGCRVLADAARRVEGALPAGQAVTTELAHGPVVRTLAEMSPKACLVVLQRRQHSLVERLVTSSVTHDLVARARAPVVCVPEDWRPEEERRAVAGDEDAHDVLVDVDG